MKEITSKNHKTYTQDSNKISLSCFDDMIRGLLKMME